MPTSALIAATEIAGWTWLQLKHAADRHDHPFHLITMATVTPDGRPSARVMTIRGCDRSGGRLWFYTRMDTPKIADLRNVEAACLVAYDPAIGVQLRLSGITTLHQHSTLAQQHWQHLSEVAVWLYELPEEVGPGAVGIDPRLPHDHEKLAAGMTARERANFGVIEFAVQTVDWHQANGVAQRRAVLHANEHWRCHVV